MLCYKFERRFGIEVEFLSKYGRDTLVPVLSEVLGTEFYVKAVPYLNETRDHYVLPSEVGEWELIIDKSVKAEGYYGLELVSPVLTDVYLLEKLVSCLSDMGCIVNETAGIHIHWDKPDKDLLTHIMLRTFKYQNALLHQFKVPEYRFLKYCMPYPETVIAEFKDHCRPEGISPFKDVNHISGWLVDKLNTQPEEIGLLHPKNPARYYLVNLHSLYTHNTVEFRWFNSSLDIGVIIGYLYFLEYMYLGQSVENLL